LIQNNNDPNLDPAQDRDQLLSGILASDLALEISAEFDGSLSTTRRDVGAATTRVLGRFHSALASPQEGPVVLLALAALQLREGQLHAVIRDAALDLIETGEALAAYKPDDFSQRKSVAIMLQNFSQLLSQAIVAEDTADTAETE
jgi:hypothetical protein